MATRLARSANTVAARSRPASPHPGGFDATELPAAFELLGRIGRAVVATIGPECEVVVHDLRQPEHSVIAISGNLTGRRVGAPVPDRQLLPGEVDKFTEDDLRRTAITPTGRELLASTSWIRDRSGHIVGALCINVDRSGLERARDLIDAHLGPPDRTPPPLFSFASDIEELTQTAVAAVIGRGPRRRLHPAQRVELLRRLDNDGVFALRGGASHVAADLGVSRSTVYGDLRKARAARPARKEGATDPRDA